MQAFFENISKNFYDILFSIFGIKKAGISPRFFIYHQSTS
jgi:hypothetical protein